LPMPSNEHRRGWQTAPASCPGSLTPTASSTVQVCPCGRDRCLDYLHIIGCPPGMSRAAAKPDRPCPPVHSSHSWRLSRPLASLQARKSIPRPALPGRVGPGRRRHLDAGSGRSQGAKLAGLPDSSSCTCLHRYPGLERLGKPKRSRGRPAWGSPGCENLIWVRVTARRPPWPSPARSSRSD